MSIIAALLIGQMFLLTLICGVIFMMKMMLDKLSAYHAQNQAEIRAFMDDLAHVPKVPHGG